MNVLRKSPVLSEGLNKLTTQLNNKEAAVIVLHDLSTDSIVLTLRSSLLAEHPGEVSFPGGKCHPEDSSFLHTALRELEEELGIRSDRLLNILEMAEVFTIGGYRIHPWYAQIEALGPLNIDSGEVAEVFTLPISEVKKASNYKRIEVMHARVLVKTVGYRYKEKMIWGATARIMRQLGGMFL